MQRIRIGLTGLAFVFLLVLLGTAITRSSSTEEEVNVTTVNSAEPNEPLAELGVAPGQRDGGNEASAERNQQQ